MINNHRPIGSRVYIGPAYQGQGRYAPDACSGQWWYVVKVCPGGRYSPHADYLVAKHTDDDGDSFVTAQRCFDSPEDARAERLEWARVHGWPAHLAEHG
jgi:hypothetical protein